MIYTSYFGQLKNIPSHITPIAICGKSPSWYEGYEYKKLAPKYEFFVKWRESKDNDYYISQYTTQVLDKLNVQEVIQELYQRTGAKDVVLICYEKPNDFCHRHLVSDWLNKNGVECNEYTWVH